MKLEDIFTLWKQDTQIDRSELGLESLKIPQLHEKYFSILSTERMILKKLEKEFKQLYRAKIEYYSGTISEEELAEWGWQPFTLKVIKSDISIYTSADKDLSAAELKIDLQNEKVQLLESIIKSITNRGFAIKNAIDWEKFKMGA
jgi:hypothetical protein